MSGCITKNNKFSIVVFCLLFFIPGIAQAAEFIVTVPDNLMLEGEKWEHFTQAPSDQKAQIFLEKVVLAPEMKLIRDLVITCHTKGRIRDWDQSGITVEVRR